MASDRWLTFDCYGTLIDWETGLWSRFEPFLKARGRSAERRRTLDAYIYKHEAGVEGGAFKPYREVVAEASRRLFQAEWALRLTDAEAAEAAAAIPEWKPFPDVPPALERLRKTGWRLAILSNIEDALLEASIRAIGVPFDGYVTAQQVRSYKPAPGHWEAARRRYGLEPARWVHVAASLYHDIAPARSMGLRAAWVDRDTRSVRAELVEARTQPTWTVPDLTPLPKLLEAA